jgi:type I restriction enzyme R subunit
LFFDQIEQDMMVDSKLKKQAQNNSKDNFKFVLKDALEDKAYKRMDQNQKIFIKMMNDGDFHEAIVNYFVEKVYKAFRNVS